MSGELEEFLQNKARMPGYTGFRPGVRATIAKTPAISQAVAAATPRGGGGGASSCPLLLTLTATTTTTTPRTANTNNTPSSLFPALQPPGPQPSARPSARAPARGAAPGVDVDAAAAADGSAGPASAPIITATAADFGPPSLAFARVRSPMRNKELEAAGPGVALCARYDSAHARLGGDPAVAAMMARTRERLLAKLTGQGDNAFRLRRLFRAYDTRPPTGLVSIEDFRQALETFGVQLGDDALLALFRAWDPQGTGSLPYEPLVAALLADGDAFALYAPARAAAEGAQGAADARAASAAARAIAAAARGGAAAVRRVLGAMAEDNEQPAGRSGPSSCCSPPLKLLSWPAFVAGLASVGVALSAQQQAYVRDARQGFVVPGGGGGVAGAISGTVDWRHFCSALDEVERG